MAAGRWARTGVRRQLGVLGLVYLVIVGVGAIFAMLALGRYSRDAEERRLLLTDLTAVERLRAAYSDQETAQRGYIISGDETFLEPFGTGQAAAATALTTLRDDLDDRPALAPVLAQVAERAERWRVEHAEPEISLRRTQGEDAAAVAVASGAGKLQFDQLRASVDSLSADIATAAEHATAAAARARRVAVTSLIASVVTTASVSLISAFLLACWAFLINPEWVRIAANAYAERLLASSEMLQQTAASSSPEKPAPLTRPRRRRYSRRGGGLHL